jgi:hypothetical protein
MEQDQIAVVEHPAARAALDKFLQRSPVLTRQR